MTRMKIVVVIPILVLVAAVHAERGVAQGDRRPARTLQVLDFDALLGDAASDACPLEAGALESCGLGLSLLTCGLCFLTAADIGITTLVNPAADPLGEMCNGIMDPGGYCADLERCIGDSCPGDCGGPVRDLAVCAAKSGCDADISEVCYASATAPSPASFAQEPVAQEPVAQEPVAQESVGESLGDFIGDALGDLGNLMGDALEDLGNITGGDINGDALEDLGNFAGDALEDIGNLMGDALEDLGNITAGEFNEDALEDLGNFAGDALEDIGNLMGDALEDLRNITGGDFDGDVLEDLGNFAGDALASLVPCSDESAVLESCDPGSNAADWADCEACKSSSMDVNATAPGVADLVDLPALWAERCDGMKSGGYCTDLERCIRDNCPEACQDPMRAVTTCNIKELLNCDVICYSGVHKEPAVGAEAVTNGQPDNAADPAAGTEIDNSGKSFSQISVLVMAAIHVGVGVMILSTFLLG